MSSAKVVWTYGATTGVGLGILLIVTLLFAPPPILLIGFILAPIVAFLLVGMLASKQTGRVRTGRLAGYVAGLTCGIMICAAIWVLILNGVVRKFGWTDSNHWPNILMGLAIGFGAILGVSAGIGAGIGTLGGLIGKRKANVPPAGDPMYSTYPQQQEPQQYSQQQQ